MDANILRMNVLRLGGSSAADGVVNFDFTGGSLPFGTTFSRASSGSYYDNAGSFKIAATDVARYSYNPSTLANRGILIEPAATNGVFPSIPTITGSVYNTNGGSTTDNATAAPDGNTVATLLKDTTSNAQHQISSVATVAMTSGSKYVLTLFAKPQSQSIIQLGVQSSVGAFYANFNLATGATDFQNGVSSSIVALPNGWFKCVFVIQASATASSAIIIALTGNQTGATGRVPTYLGVGTGVYVWGAEIEAGAISTSHIPTTTATATRAADALAFTIPPHLNFLTYTFDDNSTQKVSVSSGAYTVPTNLNRPSIKSILGSVV